MTCIPNSTVVTQKLIEMWILLFVAIYSFNSLIRSPFTQISIITFLYVFIHYSYHFSLPYCKTVSINWYSSLIWCLFHSTMYGATKYFVHQLPTDIVHYQCSHSYKVQRQSLCMSQHVGLLGLFVQVLVLTQVDAFKLIMGIKSLYDNISGGISSSCIS